MLGSSLLPVESIDIETTNYSKITRIWPHNMLLWLPEITIDRGHSPKAYSPKADSEHRHLHIQHYLPSELNPELAPGPLL